jgi:hypothetical protein
LSGRGGTGHFEFQYKDIGDSSHLIVFSDQRSGSTIPSGYIGTLEINGEEVFRFAEYNDEEFDRRFEERYGRTSRECINEEDYGEKLSQIRHEMGEGQRAWIRVEPLDSATYKPIIDGAFRALAQSVGYSPHIITEILERYMWCFKQLQAIYFADEIKVLEEIVKGTQIGILNKQRYTTGPGTPEQEQVTLSTGVYNGTYQVKPFVEELTYRRDKILRAHLAIELENGVQVPY